ncbi:MAG: fibronectin type III domain-containing protein [Spirochaetales bacterium]|nr:fibronectin type III domain-containing protein [Spirochaetales bacterium]
MKTRCIVLIVLFFLGTCCVLFAVDQKISLGKTEQWRGILTTEGVMTAEGKWGYQDLLLQDSEYTPDDATDLLLHFNSTNVKDASGSYSIVKSRISVNKEHTRFGEGCAVLQLARGIELVPGINSMFAPRAFVRDFSIEFWLYPASLTDGESVFVWEGVSLQNSEFYRQKIDVTVFDRKLVWRFDNFFRSPEREDSSFSVSSIERMVPRVWQHHMVRFNSSRGILQYCINGIPVGVLYTTRTGHEGSEIWLPQMEQNDRSTIHLGKSFTGFMDELRIQREYVLKPVLEKYQNRSGQVTTRVFDMGYSGTRIKSVTVHGINPGDSQMSYFIRASDTFNTIEKLKEPWVPFIPGALEQMMLAGRYVQIRIEFFPNGTNSETPRLYDLEINYEPDFPPVSPADLKVVPGNGKVTLSWKPVTEDDVAGYMVFYGPRPMQYTGEGALQGNSPIDVGKVSSFVVTGLENGRLYYFSVVAYDLSHPPHLSDFSIEKSGRPSEVLP